MLQVRASHDSEAGVMPSAELIAAMGVFNQSMIDAGIMLAGEGLQASAKGARITFSDGKASVVEPPYAAPNELISGFWIIDVPSREAAIDWAQRVPFRDGAIDVRQIFEAADFPADLLPPEAAEREQAWRAAQNKAGRS
ncbi:MAG TPA: YciI family protein [Stellaceae bacterium]|nr:YciI family protein [Stellaceae bacterium]